VRALAPLLCALAIGASCAGAAPIHRSHAAVAAFKRQSPCPATGAPSGPCPGWIVDHITPLCAGGADAPHNMQWQTVPDAAAKDRLERAQCSRHQSQRIHPAENIFSFRTFGA